jgi:arylsulfatase A-like enzyme
MKHTITGLLLGLALSFQAFAAGDRPNIVLILLDDLDATTSPYWNALPATQQLLKSRGVTFDEAFAPTPICCPARSTILTGKYGHNTGVLTNGGDQGGWATFVANGNEERTLAVWLQNAGYRTALIGKYLNGIESDPTHIPPGWNEWYGSVDNLFYFGYGYTLNENGTLVQYGNTEADYNTDVVAAKAVDFIRRATTSDAASQPFMLYVAPTAPHLPLPPARRHKDNPYVSALAPRRPNYNEADVGDKPRWLRATANMREAIVNAWNDVDYQNRMGSLYAVDEMVSEIVATLEERGVLDNTWIIFTSDNGYNLGAHRLIHKMAPYEESIRVPLVIAGPGVNAGLQGKSLQQFTLESDYAPTIADIAGVAVPADVDGRSLLPLLRGETPSSWRSDMLLQYVTAAAANGVGAELPAWFFVMLGQDIPGYRALRDATHLYVEWYTDPRIPHEYELYDLAADPFQLTNLLATPAGQLKYHTVVEKMQARLQELADCKGESCR